MEAVLIFKESIVLTRNEHEAFVWTDWSSQTILTKAIRLPVCTNK